MYLLGVKKAVLVSLSLSLSLPLSLSLSPSPFSLQRKSEGTLETICTTRSLQFSFKFLELEAFVGQNQSLHTSGSACVKSLLGFKSLELEDNVFIITLTNEIPGLPG